MEFRIHGLGYLAIGAAFVAQLTLGSAGLRAAETGGAPPPKPFSDAHDPDGGAFGVFAAFTEEFKYFAGSLGLDATAYKDWAGSRLNELGATWTRSNLQLIWDLVEPVVGGGYRWTASAGGDDVFAGAARAGVSYLAVFHSGGAAQPGSGQPQLRDPLDDLAAYQRFVEAAVERYDGDGEADAPGGIAIKHWQVGNEIPGWTASGRTAADYVRWFAATAEAARWADPEARMVLVASLSGGRLDPFHAEVIAALGAQSVRFDAVDIHHWGRADLAASRMDGLPAYRAALAAAGVPAVELWSCEHGTYVGRPVPRIACSPACPADQVCAATRRCVPRCTALQACPLAGQVCDEESGLCVEDYPVQTYEDQARSLVYRYVVNRALGIRRILWNNLAAWHCFGGSCNGYFDLLGLVVDGQGPGETQPDAVAVRPAFHAFRMLAERTEEAVAEQLGEVATGESRAHVYAYRDRASGRTGLVAWADSPLTVPLQIGGNQAELTGLLTDTGGRPLRTETLPAPGGQASVALDPNPVWIAAASLVPPPAPSQLAATVKTRRRVALAWSDVPDESGYRVEMRRGAGEFTEIARVAANVTSLAVQGLRPGSRYAFRVRAHNEAGFSSYSPRAVVVMP